jgi:hypothetical protein
MSSILLSARVNRSILVAAASELAAKLLSLLPTASFVVNGAPMTSAQMQSELLAYVAAVQATNSARVQAKNMEVAEKNALVLVKAATRALYAYVVAQFGVASTVFSGLGFTVNKVGRKSAATKAEAVLKGKATREARDTGGKREKEDIHGAAPAVEKPDVKGH